MDCGCTSFCLVFEVLRRTRRDEVFGSFEALFGWVLFPDCRAETGTLDGSTNSRVLVHVHCRIRQVLKSSWSKDSNASWSVPGSAISAIAVVTAKASTDGSASTRQVRRHGSVGKSRLKRPGTLVGEEGVMTVGAAGGAVISGVWTN